MKSLLLSLCIFAAAIVATRGFVREEAIAAFNDESADNFDAQLENLEDKDGPKNRSNPHNCDCDGVCDALHYSRLPKDVRVRMK